MADDRYDYYSNYPDHRAPYDRDRDRDVYLDNRTGATVPGRGYRASQDQDRSRAERHYGDRDYFRDYFGRQEESRSFRPDRDYGIDRGYRAYPERPDGGAYDRYAADSRQRYPQEAGRAYVPDYNPYPSYGFGGYDIPYQYESDPRFQRNAGPHGNDRGFWDRTGDTIASWFGDDEARRRHQADMARATHQGRGPKAYKRTDSRIQEDVNDRLTDDHWLDATHIEVKVQDTEVTLTGTVASRDDRRHAERLAEHVSGVTHVQNNLRVDASKSHSGQPGVSDGVNATLDKQAQGRH